MESIQQNPYRLFFLLGAAGLFAGLSVWIIFGFFSSEYYLGRMHAHYMIGIFLLSFVIGFLMTAIPRMSGTEGPSKRELVCQLLPMISAAFWGLFEAHEIIFFSSLSLSLVVLFIFCFRRIKKITNRVPDVFPMVIISLLSGFIGTILFQIGHVEIGGRLFYLNLILGLCVGVGAKLIPMILGLGCSQPLKSAEMWTIGILLTMACFIESYWVYSYGAFLRFILLFLVFFRYWKIHRLSAYNSPVAWGIRLAAGSIVLGTMGLWLFPSFRLESLHLVYISGFGLLTFMVASRIILAHGNYDLSLELKNWFIKIPIFLIVIATLTRISAVFINGEYEKHLGYAALTFIVAAIIWSYYFLPKLLLRRN